MKGYNKRSLAEAAAARLGARGIACAICVHNRWYIIAPLPPPGNDNGGHLMLSNPADPIDFAITTIEREIAEKRELCRRLREIQNTPPKPAQKLAAKKAAKPAPSAPHSTARRGRPRKDAGPSRMQMLRELLGEAGPTGLTRAEAIAAMQQHCDSTASSVGAMLSSLGKRGELARGLDQRWRLAA